MRRLSRLLSRSSVSDTGTNTETGLGECHILDSPTEILLVIDSYLAYENAIALSLTCKALYKLLFIRRKPTTRHHGREVHLLRLMEKDLPGQLSCPIHERFYSWRKEKSKHYQCPRCTINKRRHSSSLVICNKACKSGFHGIFESERRLMLRYALLGMDYGISTRALDHVCKKGHSNRANEVRPRIVNGSLMLWRTHHCNARIDFQFWHEIGIAHFDEAICVHSEINLRALVCATVRYARKRREFMMSNSAPKSQLVSEGHWSCPMLFKCHQCSTDVKMRMDQLTPNEVVIRFDVYQDLGGLNELGVSQRQVLGAIHDWRQQVLTDDEKLIRLKENLEQKFHGDADEDSTSDVRSSLDVPENTCFLHQWTYTIKDNPEDPVTFHVDPIVPKRFQICFDTDTTNTPK